MWIGSENRILKINYSAIADAYTGITQKWGKGKVPKLIS